MKIAAAIVALMLGQGKAPIYDIINKQTISGAAAGGTTIAGTVVIGTSYELNATTENAFCCMGTACAGSAGMPVIIGVPKKMRATASKITCRSPGGTAVVDIVKISE